jgi:hypothetical protein
VIGVVRCPLVSTEQCAVAGKRMVQPHQVVRVGGGAGELV